MAAKVEDLGGNKVKLEFEVPADLFNNAIEKVYRKERQKYDMHGFRKGKVPRSVIEARFGRQVFHEEALNEAFPQAYADAVAETGIKPVSQPENLQLVEITPDNVVKLTAEAYVLPEVKLGNYEGLQTRRRHYTVTDDDVEEQIDKIRHENASWTDKEGPAENGDVVVMDFTGSIDGVPFEGGSAVGHAVLLGSQTMIPGFEEQLVGLSPGEDGNVKVTFPENYGAEELQGKDADFAVHVQTVRRAELPEKDNDFAEDISDFETMEELRADLKQKMQEGADRNMENEVDQNLLLQITSDSEVLDIPEVMITKEMDDQINDMARNLARRGMTLEQYLSASNTTMQQLQSIYRPQAAAAIKSRLVMDALIKAIDAPATEEQIEARITKLAEEQNVAPEALRSRLTPEQRGAIEYMLSLENALAKVRELGTIEDVEVADEELEQPAAQSADSSDPGASDAPPADSVPSDEADAADPVESEDGETSAASE